MTRFCATLSLTDPHHEIAQMGGDLAYSALPCALGALPDERPAGEVGPYTTDGALVAVGEVTLYNRPALVAELTRHGPPPWPACRDGEILLRFYELSGIDGFARVNGMFSLAIWDGHCLLLVRDPVGARTLFYAQTEECWGAASSLRALRRWPRLPTRLNLAAVGSFLTFAYLPGAETLLENVHELLPGSFVRLYPNRRSDSPANRMQATPQQSYWEPYEQAWNPSDPPEHYATQLRQLLEAAVAASLPSGEGVGIFLSGGLDSSLVTALAARLHDRPVQTYALNFGPDLPNELAYSSLVAAHCRTHHHVLTFTGEQIAANLAETVAKLDCPVGDPLTTPNLLLSRAAAADGLSVILNGEGGDPCFGGPKNIPMLLFEWYRPDAKHRPDAWHESTAPGGQGNLAPSVRARAYLRSYRKCYRDLPRLLTPAVLEALRQAPPLERLVQPFLESARMPHYLNRLFYANVRTKGAHHILTKVERLTASCGLEGRSPLFQPPIVDYSFAIPPQFKLSGTTEKWILKQAVEDLLPATIVYRPKSGMRVPVQYWLHGPLRDLVDEVLLSPQAQGRGLFRPETIRTWLRGEGLRWHDHGAKLWLVLTLELWLRAYLDHAEPPPSDFVRPKRRWWRPFPSLG